MPDRHESGDPGAPAVVFWPGLGGTGLTPIELAPALVARGRRVIGLDPPADPDTCSDLGALADVLVSAARGSLVAMGHSWGAAVAALCAARYPDRTEALVLLDGGFMSLSEYEGGSLDDHLSELEEHRRSLTWDSWDAMLADARRRKGRWSGALEQALRDEACELDGRIVPRMSSEAAAGALRGLDAYDPRSVLPAFAQAGFPVLLAVAREPPGRREQAAPFVERFLESVPTAEVLWLDAGHDVVGDLGPGLGETIAEWLEEHA